MHIEPGIVQGAKIVLSYGTAAISFGFAAKFALDNIKKSGILPFVVKSLITTMLVFVFFEVFPHHAIGVSEVHLILGSTLFLIFGIAPTAFGLAFGLLIQGLFFAQFDLPQYGMNVTTLLMPLFAMSYVSSRIIPKNIAYKDIKYFDALKLSTMYQGGIVTWVAFWALYGQGFAVENLTSVLSFGAAYMSVIILEPLIDLAVLAGAKTLNSLKSSAYVEARLYNTGK
ncbi:cobalt transporter [Malaciobacter molluscorum LMG 25693]|uniref:Cobalt transporter n=1 Tax=Malaciobacter molluscorum LMG 25693 TaxID=870501 RepID=A0A2G1DGJ6_9BACT|nr:energy-coupling factor ABC transporter permease [Malaciobacter molluscorum]AXX92509.1 putative cobalt transporter [Malaciobacter molluscorum LMG 25693]PHO17622.1 cobalt transporter [Malaciobacter molluscorum LMG 25693]